MAQELPVKLSDDDRAARVDTLLAKLEYIESLQRKKRDDAKSTQTLIDAELEECQRLRRVLREDTELRKQGDLRFGDEVVPSSAEATEALAKVAEAAEKLPSEPHAFEPTDAMAEDDPCRVCGSQFEDPIHAQLAIEVEGTEEETDETHVGEAG